MSNRQDGEASHDDTARIRATELEESAADGDVKLLRGPSPDISVERALKEQLQALRTNDDPYTNAGIKAVFNFATPGYRSGAGGSLEAFVEHMTDPIHRALVDHRDSERGRLQVDDGVAREKVVITDEDGDEATYEFTLEKQTEGKYQGCWMTSDIDLVYVGRSPDHHHMPSVAFDGVEIKCKEGEILRNVLLRASGVSPYNQAAQYANCNGMGLCGTCAVEVEGEVTERTAQERRRLRLPPHTDNDGEDFRLSCQCRVQGDLVVRKGSGTWGQHLEEYAKDSDEEPGEPIRASDEEYQGIDTASKAASQQQDRETDVEKADLDLSDEAQALFDEAEQMLQGDDDDDQLPTGDE